MSDACKEKWTGHVMSVSLGLNAASFSMTEMGPIAQRIQEEIKKVQAVKEKEEAAEKNLPAAELQSRAAITPESSDTNIPTDPEEKRRALDQSVMCSIMCCCNQHPATGKIDQDLKQNCAHRYCRPLMKLWAGKAVTSQNCPGI
jgi:hypothetical protein